MLLLSETLINKSVLSLRTGSPVAEIYGFVINPNNLKVEGLYCHDKLAKQNLILLYQDIRNIINQGVIINDHDVLSAPEDLVRLEEVLKTNFQLLGKPVITSQKSKVGKVREFAIDNETFYVQKIYVAQSLLKNFNGGQLSIDRTQIVEVTDSKIIIQNLLNTDKATAPGAVPVAPSN